MPIRLLPKTTLAALAAIGLFLPIGAPLPGSCLRTTGVAGAAPSPSCGGDLRECLRASADMRQTTFGGRYVTADDVARCMEAFNACAHGGAGSGGNSGPSVSGSRGGGSGETASLPRRFKVSDEQGGIVSDCRVDGDKVNCTLLYEGLPDTWESYSGTDVGTLAGMTFTGIRTESYKHVPNQGCYSTTDYSGPVKYVFGPEGTVAVSLGPRQFKGALHNCGPNTGTESRTDPPVEYAATWSPTE